MLTPMIYKNKYLELIDQRLLPVEEKWVKCSNLEQVALAIENMTVRGAPAIGCTAAFGLAIDIASSSATAWSEYAGQFDRSCQRLAGTRPTAVNLFYAIKKFQSLAQEISAEYPISEAAEKFESLAQFLYDDDIATCKAIGDNGLKVLGEDKLTVLTHCNAGALATAAYGTALGVIRSLHTAGRVKHVYVDETRPWLQGARLTAYEMLKEEIDHSLIADSTAAWLMQQSKIDMVVVGADRIASNGDAANKIGTYSVAVNAAYHKIPFFIAAPLSTFDSSLDTGAVIPVEQRGSEELSKIGDRQISPVGTEVYNPSFDVTPSDLISGIITERGILYPPFRTSIASVLP